MTLEKRENSQGNRIVPDVAKKGLQNAESFHKESQQLLWIYSLNTMSQ